MCHLICSSTAAGSHQTAAMEAAANLRVGDTRVRAVQQGTPLHDPKAFPTQIWRARREMPRSALPPRARAQTDPANKDFRSVARRVGDNTPAARKGKLSSLNFQENRRRHIGSPLLDLDSQTFQLTNYPLLSHFELVQFFLYLLELFFSLGGADSV